MYTLLNETEWFLVLSKHPEVSFNNEHDSENGLFKTLKSDFPNNDLHAVHRLDKVTSGLLLIAKNATVASELSELFQNKNIKKTYIALSDQKPKKKQGTVAGDIKRSRRGTWKLSRTHEHPSKTQFTSFSVQPNLRAFILSPLTGKTHQLRVVMKSIGSPILGDTLYSGTIADRTYLHAYKLEFTFREQSYVYTHLPLFGQQFINHKQTLQTHLENM